MKIKTAAAITGSVALLLFFASLFLFFRNKKGREAGAQPQPQPETLPDGSASVTEREGVTAMFDTSGPLERSGSAQDVLNGIVTFVNTLPNATERNAAVGHLASYGNVSNTDKAYVIAPAMLIPDAGMYGLYSALMTKAVNDIANLVSARVKSATQTTAFTARLNDFRNMRNVADFEKTARDVLRLYNDVMRALIADTESNLRDYVDVFERGDGVKPYVNNPNFRPMSADVNSPLYFVTLDGNGLVRLSPVMQIFDVPQGMFSADADKYATLGIRKGSKGLACYKAKRYAALQSAKLIGEPVFDYWILRDILDNYARLLAVIFAPKTFQPSPGNSVFKAALTAIGIAVPVLAPAAAACVALVSISEGADNKNSANSVADYNNQMAAWATERGY